MSDSRILLEVCVDSTEGLQAAISGGADRIELCSALELGGLTPSPGLIAVAAGSPVPVYAMIRPRAGHFMFSTAEIDLMFHEIDAVRAAGLRGVVLGANRNTGALDEVTLTKLMRHSADLGTSLHRAIDLAPDLVEAMMAAIGLGFERVLSSGGAESAEAGIETLAAMHAAGGGRISIMPGSGVCAENVARILRAAPFREVHGSCSEPVNETDTRPQSLGFAAGPRRATSVRHVARLKAALLER